MAFQALRRAVAAPKQRNAFRYLLQQQIPGLAPPVTSSSSGGMASAADARTPLWALASRMVATARDVGREADSGLLHVLKSELDHERKSYSQPKELARGAPKPWTVTDKPGHADVILRRAYGQEDIAVTCVYQPDSYAEERDPEDVNSEDDLDQDGDGACVNMTVTINKGADYPTLEVSAVSYGSEITIDHVYIWEDKDTKEARYDGPNFLQLDEEVQNQFERFIKARGVNKELTGYLFALLADKEQREYMRWLQKVEAFLKQ
jgi:hypothetical protein